MSYLRYLCLFVHSDIQHILCFVLFFFICVGHHYAQANTYNVNKT